MKILKKIYLLLSFPVIIIAGSCNEKQRIVSADDIPAEPRIDATTSNSNQSDQDFLKEATEINLAEIKLGMLAQRKGLKQEVINLGKMMEDQHSKSLTELKALADKMHIAIPREMAEQ